jgi:hypothetical protein
MIGMACDVQAFSAVFIWIAARAGDLAEVERLVGQDLGQLDAKDYRGSTPLMYASREGHVGVLRWLLDEGAAVNERNDWGRTALWLASSECHPTVVRLLLEKGADPTIAATDGSTPLLEASGRGHLEVARVLLGHRNANATINQRNCDGVTALWVACFWGRGVVARVLLENGADPTIGPNIYATPTAMARQEPEHGDISAEGRRECVAALEVRLIHCALALPLVISCLKRAVFVVLGMVAGRRWSWPTSSGRPGRWRTRGEAARWWLGGGRRGGRGGRRGRRWWTSW